MIKDQGSIMNDEWLGLRIKNDKWQMMNDE